MFKQGFDNRQAGAMMGFLHLLDEFLRLLHARTYPQANQHEHHAEDERNAPAPCPEGLVVHRLAQDRHDAGSEYQPDAVTHLNPAAIERLLFLRCAFDGHQRRAAPFAADGEALNRS